VSIIDHGTWTSYKPERTSADAPENALFLRRESDGADWYAYVRSGKHFRPDTVKLVLEQRDSETVVRTVAVEAPRLFPINGHVVEIENMKRKQDESSLLEEFVNRRFDLKTARTGERLEPKQADNILARLTKLEERLTSLEQQKSKGLP